MFSVPLAYSFYNEPDKNGAYQTCRVALARERLE